MKKRFSFLLLLVTFYAHFNFSMLPTKRQRTSYPDWTNLPEEMLWNIVLRASETEGNAAHKMFENLRYVNKRFNKVFDEKKNAQKVIILLERSIADLKFQEMKRRLESLLKIFKDILDKQNRNPLNIILQIMNKELDRKTKKFFKKIMDDLLETDFESYFKEKKLFPKAENITHRSSSPRIWDVPDANGTFPLELAIKNNDKSNYDLLSVKDGDPNKIYKGRNTLMTAALFAHINTHYLERIVVENKYVKTRNVDNKQVLNFFDEKYNTEPVLWILVKKAYETNDREEFSRLVSAISLVIENGADFNIKVKGQTLLDLGLIVQENKDYKIRRTFNGSTLDIIFRPS